MYVSVCASVLLIASTRVPGPAVPAHVALHEGCHSPKLCLPLLWQIPVDTPLPLEGEA